MELSKNYERFLVDYSLKEGEDISREFVEIFHDYYAKDKILIENGNSVFSENSDDSNDEDSEIGDEDEDNDEFNDAEQDEAIEHGFIENDFIHDRHV
jgi:hypothetical protein